MKHLRLAALTLLASLALACGPDEHAATSEGALVEGPEAAPGPSLCATQASERFLDDESRRGDLTDDDAEPVERFLLAEIDRRCARDGEVDVARLVAIERAAGRAVAARAAVATDDETALTEALVDALAAWDAHNAPTGAVKALLDATCVTAAQEKLAASPSAFASLTEDEAAIARGYADAAFRARCAKRGDAGYVRVLVSLLRVDRIVGRQTTLAGPSLVSAIVAMLRPDPL